MTAIAWDGKTLAADNMAVSSHTKFHADKIFVIHHHELGKCMFGMSGALKTTDYVKDVLEGRTFHERGKGVDTLEPDSTYGMLIDSNKTVYDIHGDCVVGPAVNMLDRFAANGSAWEFVLGAMCAGACAERAIGLAEEHRTDVGFGCTTLVWSEVFADYNNERFDNDLPY